MKPKLKLKKKWIVIIIFTIAIILIAWNRYDNYIKNTRVKVSDDTLEKGLFKDYYKEAQKTVAGMTLQEKVGQLFLVRYNANDVEYLSNFYPGGYILFAKDFQANNKEEMIAEIKKDQEYNKYPLIIAVDEEGGTVTRVSRYIDYREEAFKSPKEYFEEGGYKLLEKTETEKAKLLKELGINLNLAPVADISTNENDFIYNRAFGQGTKETSEFVKNMVTYANKNNINSCLKHFPGYGNNEDTHTGVAIDERSYNEINSNDFKPFKAGIEAGVPCVLVSHNVVISIDNNYPASLSKEVIAELRDNLEFTGIIITDDLAMDAVKSYVDDGRAATLAINAGNDMIITSDFMKMKNEIIESVENGDISEETLNNAVVRIIAWKYYSGLFKK